MEERASGQQWTEGRNGPRAGIETPAHFLPQIGIARSERRVLQVGDVLAVAAGPGRVNVRETTGFRVY